MNRTMNKRHRSGRCRLPAAAKRYLRYLYILILLFITALNSPHLDAAGVSNHGGHLRIALEYKMYGFDVIQSPGLPPTGWVAGSLIMERLFEADQNGGIRPVLGLSATASEDQTIWTVELRRNVRFHDGTAFDADAVVGHWQRILNPENRYRGRLALQPIRGVEKVASHTVRFHLRHPWKPFLSALTNHRSLAALIPSPRAVAEGTQNRTPVGTGPFVFKVWRSADRLVADRNPEYWQPDRPYLDAITIRIIPDHESRYAALASGEVDMIYTDRPKHIRKLSSDSRFEKTTAGGSGAIILLLNTRKPPLDDVRVRQALAHAWDQKAYLAASLKNTMPYAEHWYGDTLNCGLVDYCGPDLDKAKALIDAYGKPVVLEYLHSATPRGRETVAIVQQMLKAIGVGVKPVALDFGGIMKRLFSRQFDMASWLIPGTDEMGPITRLTFSTESPFNLSGYSNPSVDELLLQQSKSLNQGDRRKALCKVARLVNAEAPHLYLFGRQYHIFSTKKVRDLPPPRNEYIQLSNVWLAP